jgi:hypothetical protein
MSSWSSVVALSGFEYDGGKEAVTAVPRVPHRSFRSFWASGTGWGEFSYASGTSGGTFFTLRVLAGKLRCRSILITSVGKTARLRVGGTEYAHTASARGNSMLLTAKQTMVIAEGEELRIETGA